ncbi:hypothetical protein KFL_012970010 [Klebsormidium nitens]|uniref:PHD-type domain-containing protein n=1 Tax=Klebsormidium nitens TaxID=105231 RepID=A0A1Y1IWI5_KLENI|nr:hypothetical protein KFL_012970010 [Klebsormidium nitens]|eukprot:GAQ93097.1 hypothetical protein KFL_012970010 [Klebsormidium nitens]
MVERIVQIVKKAMRKNGLLFRQQAALGPFSPVDCHGVPDEPTGVPEDYSPYYRLFGQHPIVWSKIRDIFQEPIDLDDPILCAKFLHDRAELFQKIVPMAFDKLTIAKHRDILRYAHTRSGDSKPKLRQYEDPVFTEANRDQACQVCHKTIGAAKMLLCDNCDEGWHMHCLIPPVKRMPKGT